MDHVKIRTHIVMHERFLEAGALARDLWTWGMLHAGHLESDGRIPLVAVLSSPWGYGDRRNVKLAERLVDLGLWAKVDQGYQVMRWEEQGNLTKANLESHRAAARKRMNRLRSGERSGEVRANFKRSDAEVPTSTSYSLSGSGSEGSDLPARSEGGAAVGGPPEWFAVEAVGVVHMTTGVVVDDIPARWVEYAGSRSRKGWPMNAQDAAAWLSTVMRSERSRKAERPRSGREIRQRGSVDYHVDETPFSETGE